MEIAREPKVMQLEQVRGTRAAYRPRVTRLFEEDPDLIEHLDQGLAAAARRRIVAPVHDLVCGDWEPQLECLSADVMGLLLLDGLLVRHVQIAGRRAAELVGPGDVVCPRHECDVFNSALPASASWRVVQLTRTAVIDADVQASIRTLPGVMSELFGRAVRRVGVVTSQRVSTKLPQLENRLLWILWQLADRWGLRAVDGVSLTLPLTHELLSDLASANRPAVSRALGRLADAGLVSKENRCWKLHGSPPLEAVDESLKAGASLSNAAPQR